MSTTVARKLFPTRFVSGRLQPAPEIAPAKMSERRESAKPLCPPKGSNAPSGGPKKSEGLVLGRPSASIIQPGGTDFLLFKAIVTLPPAIAQVEISTRIGLPEDRGTAREIGFADNRRSRPPQGATSFLPRGCSQT